MFESELFIPENRSQWPGGATKCKPSLTRASASRWVVSSPRRWCLFIVYQQSFLNVTKHLKLALFIEKNIIVFEKKMTEHITVR